MSSNMTLNDTVQKPECDISSSSERMISSLGGSSLLDSDSKKRPLSISSTSSTSSSSTSSLPRHQRKRVSNIACAVVANGTDIHVEDNNIETLTTVEEFSPIDRHSCSRLSSDDSLLYCSTYENNDESEMAISHSDLKDCQSSDTSQCSSRNGFSTNGLSGSLYISRVISEILETEKNYVEDLKDIVQVFSVLLRNRKY